MPDLDTDETLSHSEHAYLTGWSDASSLIARKSPYEKGSDADREYHRGYSNSIMDSIGEYD